MKLIVGLGNPGKQYDRTRHNVGFVYLDMLAKANNVTFETQARCRAQVVTVASEEGRRLLLARPQTFMNESGNAVRALCGYYKVQPSSCVIVHDDLDMAFGTYKIQYGRGPKVHGGINSIEEHLGTDQFWRVRIGIDNRVAGEREEGSSYVLANFTKEEYTTLVGLIPDIHDAVCRKVLGSNTNRESDTD